MKTSFLLTFTAVLTLAASAGCGTTVRSMTATKWIVPPGAVAAAAPAPPAAGAPAAAPAPEAGGIESHYYLTYWEGKCGGLTRGCTRGDTKVKHCKVASDNSVACSEDEAATKALTPN